MINNRAEWYACTEPFTLIGTIYDRGGRVTTTNGNVFFRHLVRANYWDDMKPEYRKIVDEMDAYCEDSDQHWLLLVCAIVYLVDNAPDSVQEMTNADTAVMALVRAVYDDTFGPEILTEALGLIVSTFGVDQADPLIAASLKHALPCPFAT